MPRASQGSRPRARRARWKMSVLPTGGAAEARPQLSPANLLVRIFPRNENSTNGHALISRVSARSGPRLDKFVALVNLQLQFGTGAAARKFLLRGVSVSSSFACSLRKNTHRFPFSG